MKRLIAPTHPLAFVVLFFVATIVTGLSAVDVKLTGILALPEKKRALLLLPEAAPGAPSKTCMLGEGQREGAIEVLKIDEKAGLVTIRNGGKEIELTFESDGVPLTASSPLRLPAASPAASPMAILPAPVHPVPAEMPAMEAAMPADNQVVVIGRNARRPVPQRTGIISPNNAAVGQTGPVPPVAPWRPPQPPAAATPVDATPYMPAPTFENSHKSYVLEQSPYVPSAPSAFPIPPPASPPPSMQGGGGSVEIHAAERPASYRLTLP